MFNIVMLVIVAIFAALFLKILLVDTAADIFAARICAKDLPYEEARQAVKHLYRLFYLLTLLLWVFVTYLACELLF